MYPLFPTPQVHCAGNVLHPARPQPGRHPQRRTQRNFGVEGRRSATAGPAAVRRLSGAFGVTKNAQPRMTTGCGGPGFARSVGAAWCTATLCASMLCVRRGSSWCGPLSTQRRSLGLPRYGSPTRGQREVDRHATSMRVGLGKEARESLCRGRPYPLPFGRIAETDVLHDFFGFTVVHHDHRERVREGLPFVSGQTTGCVSIPRLEKSRRSALSKLAGTVRCLTEMRARVSGGRAT